MPVSNGTSWPFSHDAISRVIGKWAMPSVREMLFAVPSAAPRAALSTDDPRATFLIAPSPPATTIKSVSFFSASTSRHPSRTGSAPCALPL
jgi:hypothetical protein